MGTMCGKGLTKGFLLWTVSLILGLVDGLQDTIRVGECNSLQ